MNPIEEALAKNFYRWVSRGGGTTLFDHPVSPAPPFVPFPGHRIEVAPVVDDGTRPNFFSRLSARISEVLHPPPATRSLTLPTPPSLEPEPYWSGEKKYQEVQILLPHDLRTDTKTLESFLGSVSHCRSPLSFEIVGSADQAVLQIAAEASDLAQVQSQLAAHFPDASLVPAEDRLHKAWQSEEQMNSLIVETALTREFMLPLRQCDSDPFVALVGALADLKNDEAAVYQVIFAPLSDPWAENAFAAVTDEEGQPYPLVPPEMVKATVKKISRPLFGALVRIAARAPVFERVVDILRGMASSFRLFSSYDGNELSALPNDGYLDRDHERDLLVRQSRRAEAHVFATREQARFLCDDGQRQNLSGKAVARIGWT